MISRQNPEAAGIIRDRLMKSKLGGKICDWFLNRSARSGLAVGILRREIVSERVMNLFQLAKKRLVLGQLFQTRLTRKLQHPHRIVIGAVPKIGIEMTKQAPGSRLPGPPKVESDLAQWLARWRGRRGDG